MPFLLMVFLVLVCLPNPGDWPKPWWTNSPWDCVLVTWFTVLLTSAYAFVVARRVRRPLAVDPSLRLSLLERYERGRFRHQIALFALYSLSLLVLGWGWAVGQLWHGPTGVHPGAELLLLAPFFVSQLAAWAFYYDAERAAYRAAQRLQAAEPHGGWHEVPRARAVEPAFFGSRLAYVLFQLRQKLALALLPVLLLLGQKELQRIFPDALEEWPRAINFLGIAFFLLVFATLPWIIRLVLGLKPLPDGPLRRRLEASARRLRFRCSNILLWNTRNGMANAMVVGILPWIRYVVFTDRLLEDFTPEEIEAVFGHEVGHVRHHHMLYYFGFLTASVIVLFWLINDVVVSFFNRVDLLDLHNPQSGWLSSVSLVAALLAYIFMVFGFLSRRCERQADVFGCRAVSCPNPACGGHDVDLVLPPRGQGLCPTGIDTFIRALEKVALVNGISRDRPGFLQSWQHSTIGRRVEFLRRVRHDLRVERRFQQRIALVKWLLLLVLGGVVAVLLVREACGDAESARPHEGSVQQTFMQDRPR